MQFTRSKKLVFFNNKGGVGKTTLAYNTAVDCAVKGFKTVLIDADAQCNLSQIALGEQFAETLFTSPQKNIYGVLQGIIEGGRDIDLTIKPFEIRPNLSILPGSLKLSRYENLLTTAYNQAAAGEQLGYFQTSALQRYMTTLGLDEEIDLFIIDCSPNLGLLNRVLLLSADYFITPLMPDAFSLQGVENLGTTLEERKKNWKNTGKALANSIPHEQVLNGEGLFLGYIMNSYNQYAQKPIKSHEERMKKIPESVRYFLSEKHCKNGLVEKSRKAPIVHIKDYGELSADSHLYNKAIFELIPSVDFKKAQGTFENREIAQQQFHELSEKLLALLQEY